LVGLVPAAGVLAALAACSYTVHAVERQEADKHYYHSPVQPTTAEHRLVAGRIKLIQLYRIDQGKSEKLVLTQEDLQTTSYLEINGYVSGIIALCEDEMAVSVDGRRMSPIKIGSDGAFWLKNFGRLNHGDLLPSPETRAYGANPGAERRGAQLPAMLPGGYAFFPAVFGDAVSPGSRFNISFNADGKKMEFIVQQNGYTSICDVVPEQPLGREPIPFCYAGTPSADQDSTSGDIDKRIRAIARGIGAVESAFSASLVDGVTIIDAEDRYNAVTCNGLRRIWFYNNAFLGEPLEELSVIAEHESLHLLVDLLQLTERTEVRELFAKLKGYEDLSRERFEMVMTGRTLPRPGGDQGQGALFFAFISENHFLSGMKGGHPQADLEEFCTSFLHSLMHIGRFGDAILRPLAARGSTPQSLSAEEKNAVVADYLRALEVFAEILATRDLQGASPAARSAMHLSSRLAQARAALQSLLKPTLAWRPVVPPSAAADK
jgi:hypothetical protein